MNEWTIVFWSSARQIAQEAMLPEVLWPADDVAPGTYFHDLRARDEVMAAVAYVAAALPKLETIAWGLASLPPLVDGEPDYAAKMLMRDTARRWLDEPDDENRRAVERLVETANREWPETLIGMAIFFSGGSIAPEDTPPVPADASLCGQLVCGAMQSLIASHAHAGPALAGSILDLADRLATSGREAIAKP